ncbi:MAG: asparagine synthase-related protein [Salinigranum sp.]
MAVRVIFADPRVSIVEESREIWVVSGVDTGPLRAAIEEGRSVADVIVSVCDRAEDAALVHVDVGPGGVRSVDAYRSVVSNCELYYGRTDDGTLFLTDQYRNAVAQVPASERTLADTAATDHLLFRAPIEPTTYLEEIRAVEHGVWVRWESETARPSTTRVDRLTGDVDVEDPVSTLEDVLGDVVRRGTRDREVTTMLSGGVDSTLLHTYVGDDAAATVLEPDAPELEFEVEYADEAANLLGADPRRVPLSEDDYLEQLEASVVRMGFPSHYGLTPVVDAAFAADPGEYYVNGEGSDALFGLTGIKEFRTAMRCEPLLESPAGSLAGVVPGAVGSRARTLSRQVEQSRRPPWRPKSFAQQFAFFTAPELAASFVGADRVAARAKRQFEYVDELVGRVPTGRFERQLQAAHFLSFYRHNTVNQWRQLAYAHGKSLFAPFKTRSVASFALGVPADRRYASYRAVPQQTTIKHLPKRVLNRRLPAYDTEKPKGSGAYPRGRFFEEGCLGGVFERYDPPAFVPEEMYPSHVESYGSLTWNLITFAVWGDRVLENDALTTLPESTVVRCDTGVSVEVT